MQLNMDPINIEVLTRILHEHEDRCKALANLTHTTEAEKKVLFHEMVACQTAYLQLEGAHYVHPEGAPDWGAATGVAEAVNHNLRPNS